MNRSGRERSMPLLFEIRDGRRSRFLLYEKVLSDRTCGRRVVAQALQELDDWRHGYARLFEALSFPDWTKFVELLERLRGPLPPRCPAHTRAKKDARYAREKFYEAIAVLDEWRRTYEQLFALLKYTDGVRITKAIDQACRPDGRQTVYLWRNDRSE